MPAATDAVLSTRARVASVLCVGSGLALGLAGDPVAHPLLSQALWLAAVGALAVVLTTVKGKDAPAFLGFWFILGTALLMRLAYLPTYPVSDDVNRYIWEGIVQGSEYSPYQLSPSAFFLDADYWLVLDRVNQPDLTAAYPPLVMLHFKALAIPYYHTQNVELAYMVHKIAAMGADLCILAVLGRLLHERRQPMAWLVVYAWNPLVLTMGAGEAHLDVYQTLYLVVGAYFMLRPKPMPWIAWPVLGGAVMMKYFAVILLPFFLTRRNWKYAPLAALPLLSFLAFPEGGWFDSLRKFGAEFHYLDVLPRGLRVVVPSPTAGLIAAGILAVALAALWWRDRRRRLPRITTLMLGWGALLVCLPTVHPWYALPLIALAALRPSRAVLVLSASMSMGIWTYAHLAETGNWQELPWVVALVWLPPAAALAWDVYSARRSMGETAAA